MVKTKTYDFSNEIIDFGFIYNGKLDNNFTVNDVIKTTKQNCIIFDTKNIILSKLISQLSDIFKNTEKILIGLTDKNTFDNIARSGLKEGFFRTTTEQSHGSIIIIDQKKMYYAIDENTVFQCSDDSVSEVFQYINFLLWNKSEYELLQGSINNVKEIRQSVVRPYFSRLLNKSKIEVLGSVVASTSDFNLNSKIKFIYSEDIIPNSTIIMKSIKSIAVKSDMCYLPVFEDLYFKADYNQKIELAHSFSNQTLSSLIGKQIWTNNQMLKVLEQNVISDEIRIPLDLYKTYSPDFDKYLGSTKQDRYLKTIISIDVLPLTLDNTYQKSSRYSKRSQLIINIDNNIQGLIKLTDEKETKDLQILKKMLEETRLFEKAKSYNEFVDKHEAGVNPLNNKKNAFTKKFVINEKDYNIPSDTTGILYEKKNHLYISVENETKINAALKFFEENNLTGSVILDE